MPIPYQLYLYKHLVTGFSQLGGKNSSYDTEIAAALPLGIQKVADRGLMLLTGAASRSDFPDTHSPDKMTRSFLQNQIGPEAGGEDILNQVRQVNLVPHLVTKHH